MKDWQPRAIISFNGEVFEGLMGRSSRGYTKRLREEVLDGAYHLDSVTYPVFQTFPAAWRYDSNAERLRRESLRRIASRLRAAGIGG